MNYDKNYMKNLFPKRPENSHKGTFGHVLNIAGSELYSGAAYFSSVSALRVGCGLVTLSSEATVQSSVASLTPDVIFYPVKKIKDLDFEKFQAISIGCGLSQERSAIKIFKNVVIPLQNIQTPIVIDADGLNILAKNKIKLTQNTILTPHPKEMSRLMDVSIEEILSQPGFWVKKCAEDFGSTVVLKLHKTLIADNHGNFYENNTGNSALGHGGSGDILCGMITGFIAQGVKPFDACCLGVYLHGLTAELASSDLTEYSTLASDLINYIPKAISSLT